MNIDFEQLKGLLELVSQNDIGELTVESGQERITVKKSSHPLAVEFASAPHTMAHEHAFMPPVPAYGAPPPPGHPAPPPGAHSPGPPGAEHEEHPLAGAPESHLRNNFVKITSPMVGTFYRSSAPDKPSFVEEGDTVTVGQTVCIIEAMKLMNDLPSEVSGRVVEILASNGATVEYGQPLFLIDPET